MKPRTPADWLKAVEVFRALPEEDLRRLYANAHTVSLKRGETLIEAGSPADALHIVMSGRLVSQPADKPSTEVARGMDEFGPGAAIDVLAFFGQSLHPATIAAARGSIVLRLGYQEFIQTSVQVPQLWSALVATFARSLAAKEPDTPRRISRPKTIALCHGGPEHIPAAFLDRFADALEARAICQFLSAEALGQDLPGGIALEDPQVIHWLEEQERLNDLVVYLADPEPTSWTERAISQADQVLIVGMHDGAAGGRNVPLNPIEQLALETHGPSGCRLALLNDRAAGVPVPGASRWLSSRVVRSHHHVSLRDQGAHDRLARFVLGRARGVFLSGAALCGAAHLGVLKAFEASGITVDAIGGTGAGAAIGGLLALGWTPDQVEDAIGEIFMRKKALATRRGGVLALFDHRRFDQQLSRIIPSCDIADLPVPYYAVSANLSTNMPFIHASGSLQTSIRANWLPPGVLLPFVTRDRQFLVDGSTLQPPPLGPLQDMGPGATFWVHPQLGPLGTSPVPYEAIPAGTSLSLDLFGRAKEGDGLSGDLPGLTDIFVRAQHLAEKPDKDKGGTAEIALLQPPMPRDLSLLDWQHHGHVVDMAYNWALREIERRKNAGDSAIRAATNDE